jgi:UDP-glucose:(heptosyl)LPS alpha-1,3-glucosyltransferase
VKFAFISRAYTASGAVERCIAAAAIAAAPEAKLTVISNQFSADTNGVDLVPRHVEMASRSHTASGHARDFAKRVGQHLASEHYDLVHSHERIAGCHIFCPIEGIHAEWLAQQARVSGGFKQWLTTMSPYHRQVIASERAVFASPTLRAVICHSEMVKADIQRHVDVDAKKIHVIRNGVDSAVFHPQLRESFRSQTRRTLNIPLRSPVALFVGSGFERSGLVGFLMGLADHSGHSHLRRESVRGIVVGDDKHLPRFQAFADQLGVADRVAFVGGVADVKPYYASADVFVSPALYDPISTACLEAMACELPIVTSTKSAAAELIAPGQEGFVVDALDTPAIGEAIGAALDSAMDGNAMGGRARARVAPFSSAAMRDQYVALYRELLRR